MRQLFLMLDIFSPSPTSINGVAWPPPSLVIVKIENAPTRVQMVLMWVQKCLILYIEQARQKRLVLIL